jgi:hypothetical protein
VENVSHAHILGNYASIFLELKFAVTLFNVISQNLPNKENGKYLTITGLWEPELSRYEAGVSTPRYLPFVTAVFS